MNYRHIYHAGNFGDIIKHLTLIAVLNNLCKKDRPFAVLDGFAGIGLYDINSDEATRTNESSTGIGKLLSKIKTFTNIPPLLKIFLDIIESCNGDNDGDNLYPGSPLIIQNMSRVEDRLIACELHPQDYETLKKVIFTNTHNIDAYQALKAFLPFKEKRGLIFLDPAFEVKNEFDKLINGLELIFERAFNICTIIWYPIKNKEVVKSFHRRCKLIGFKEILKIEFKLTEPTQARYNQDSSEDKFNMSECGLLIFNPPFIQDELKVNIDYLVKYIYAEKAKYYINLL
jgi:23S rRNA (adenine2030-N6)-methyltransferase